MATNETNPEAAQQLEGVASLLGMFGVKQEQALPAAQAITGLLTGDEKSLSQAGLRLPRGPMMLLGVASVAKTLIYALNWKPGINWIENKMDTAANWGAKTLNERASQHLKIETNIQPRSVKTALEFGMMALSSNKVEEAIEASVKIYNPAFAIPDGALPVVIWGGTLFNIIGSKLPPQLQVLAEYPLVDRILSILPGYDPVARMSPNRASDIVKDCLGKDVGKMLEAVEAGKYSPQQLEAAAQLHSLKKGPADDVVAAVKALASLQAQFKDMVGATAEVQAQTFVEWFTNTLPTVATEHRAAILGTLAGDSGHDWYMKTEVQDFIKDLSAVASAGKKVDSKALGAVLEKHAALFPVAENELVSPLWEKFAKQAEALLGVSPTVEAPAVAETKADVVASKKETPVKASAAPATINGEAVLAVSSVALEALEQHPANVVVQAVDAVETKAMRTGQALAISPESKAIMNLLRGIHDSTDLKPQAQAIRDFAKAIQENENLFSGNIGKALKIVGNAVQQNVNPVLKDSLANAVSIAMENPENAVALLAEIGNGTHAKQVQSDNRDASLGYTKIGEGGALIRPLSRLEIELSRRNQENSPNGKSGYTVN